MNQEKKNNHPRVVLILVDGMRPDGLQRADTPTMDSIIRHGIYTLQARTIFPSVTLPCHASLFFSAFPERHGILTNTWVPQVRPIPNLFDVLNLAGKTVAMFYSWEELRDLSPPGSLAVSHMLRVPEPPINNPDWDLTQVALQWLTTYDFHFAFIYLGKTDVVGHSDGWMSAPYISSLSQVDKCITNIMKSLPGDTHYIVMADHGGHDQIHGTKLDEDMNIPILMTGPRINQGKNLGDGVSILDVAPSILQILKVPAPKDWEGKTLLHL